MSLRIKAAAAITAAAAILGGAAAAPAMAATPSCGGLCIDPYVRAWAGHPLYTADVYQQRQAAGTPVILFRASNADPAEDWTISEQGTVDDFLSAGLVSKSVALNYGTDDAWEVEFSPFGVDTGLCMGVTAGEASKVALEPCGESAATVWIDDAAHRDGKYVPAITATDLNFSHPYVLTYPSSSAPTDKPRPQLYTRTLEQFSAGAVYDTQLWSAKAGVLP